MRNGFTLIEILVAIAIIGILVASGLASFDYVQKLSRDSRRKADIAELASAIERYYNKNHVYPRTAGWCTQISNSQSNWGPDFQNDLAPFISKVPLDPKFPATYQDYFYYQNPDGKSFNLFAELETEDRADPPGDGIPTGSCTRIGYQENEYDYRYPSY